MAPAATRRRGLARRGASAAAIVAQAVFGLIGEIGVAGAKLVLDVGIVLRALVGVLDQQRDRRAGRHLHAGLGMRHHAGQDLHRVRLLALRGEARLAGTAAIEIVLDVLGRSGISGGQPSTTQPIATPWLSPKVVTRNIWPKVLKDMAPFARCLKSQPVVTRGLGAVKPAASSEHGQHRLTDTSSPRRRRTRRPRPARCQIDALCRRLDPERHHQRPRRAAMGHGDGVDPKLTVPVAHPALDLDIAFAARRRHRPFLGLALGKQSGSASCISASVDALPCAIADLAQAGVDRIVAGRQYRVRRAPVPWSRARGRAGSRRSGAVPGRGHRAPADRRE